MQAPQKTPTPATLCRGGCGFYGSAATDFYCSVCYRQILQTRQQANEQQPVAEERMEEGPSPPNAHAAPPVPPVSPMPSSLEPGTELSPEEGPRLRVQPSSPTPTGASDPTVTSLSPADSPEAVVDSLPPAVVPPSPSQAAMIEHENLLPLETPEPLSDEETPRSPRTRVQTDISRCFVCNKRLGLLGFRCRCGLVCCRPHLHAEEHNCDFDYKSMAKAGIESKNPKIVTGKLERL